jgi:hypothetical protein
MQYQIVTSWSDACGTYMHHPETSQADHEVAACTYCMGTKVSSLSLIYLYSSYFDLLYGRQQQLMFITNHRQVRIDRLLIGTSGQPCFG